MAKDFTELAFSPSVKAMQEKLGVRAQNEELSKKQKLRGFSKITPALEEFLRSCRSFYMASASKSGQPYMQHRGGQAGFLHILDECHLAFADYPGNKQYISLGNLLENPKVLLFIMDYADRQRVKIWGRAEIIERGEDEAFVEKLSPSHAALFPQRAIRIKIEAWDINCPAHIPELYPAEQVAEAIGKLNHRITELEAQLAAFKKSSKSKK